MVGAVAQGETELLALGFLSGDVEPQGIAADRRRFDLEDIEQTGSHQFAKLFIDKIGTVGFAAELAESAGKVARPQPVQAPHRDPIKMVERARE